jgi:arylsulfatase
MPTFADLAGAPAPAQCDGQSFLPALTGRGEQPIHEYLVWEFHGYGGQKAVRLGDWKGVLRDIHKGGEQIELYNLKDDLGEAHDVAAEHPEIVERIARIFATDRTPNEQFPMERFDPS